MKVLKFAYLTHRQIGESEAVYRITSSMHLKHSNIATIFVSSGFPDNRSEFYRKLPIEEEFYYISELVSLDL